MKDENVMIDDEGAVRLLEPLREEPDPRTGIDVPRAMAEGLRRRRFRRWSSGLAVVALTSVTIGGGTFAVSALRDDTPRPDPSPTVTSTPSTVPTAAAPAGVTSCKVARLPTDGVKKALVTSGDPSGRYAAGRLYSTNGRPSKLIVWRDGAILTTAAMPGADADIRDMTRTGVGIANGYDAKDHQSAYVYQNGRFTRLRGNDAGAVAINEAGVIVGAVGASPETLAVRWASASAAPVKLPLPAKARQSAASGLDEDGTIIGSVGPDLSRMAAYVWFPDGTGRYLPVPTLPDGRKATGFWPGTISNGWVAGDAVMETKESTSFTPMRYRISTGEFEVLPGDIYRADLVTPEGWVTGMGRPVALFTGSRTIQLPAYGKASQSFDVSYDVRGISADGHVIVGYKAGPEMGNDPLMWTCR
ncbi:hypothetical protein [Actinoplanes sp. HUAS TT8]|uniref:hypothetical protein n=1 Tax=Actinoplanes sp. HUAS TT8 TaxID=3447453 RepID=UPI003F5271C6